MARRLKKLTCRPSSRRATPAGPAGMPRTDVDVPARAELMQWLTCFAGITVRGVPPAITARTLQTQPASVAPTAEVVRDQKLVRSQDRTSTNGLVRKKCRWGIPADPEFVRRSRSCGSANAPPVLPVVLSFPPGVSAMVLFCSPPIGRVGRDLPRNGREGVGLREQRSCPKGRRRKRIRYRVLQAPAAPPEYARDPTP